MIPVEAPAPMLLLASASPARRRLLEQARIPHRVQVSGVEEDTIQDPDPTQLVRRLARAKAEAEFDQDTVIRITLDTYARLLGPRAPEAA